MRLTTHYHMWLLYFSAEQLTKISLSLRSTVKCFQILSHWMFLTYFFKCSWVSVMAILKCRLKWNGFFICLYVRSHNTRKFIFGLSAMKVAKMLSLFLPCLSICLHVTISELLNECLWNLILSNVSCTGGPTLSSMFRRVIMWEKNSEWNTDKKRRNGAES
jgi:hypothetical protein